MEYSKVKDGELVVEYNKTVYAMNNTIDKNKLSLLEDKFYDLTDELNRRKL